MQGIACDKDNTTEDAEIAEAGKTFAEDCADILKRVCEATMSPGPHVPSFFRFRLVVPLWSFSTLWPYSTTTTRRALRERGGASKSSRSHLCRHSAGIPSQRPH